MRVLILAAASQIGKILIPQLLKETDAELTLVARNGSKRIEEKSERITFVDGDILDVALLDRAMKGQDVVILTHGVKEPMEATIAGMKRNGLRRLIVTGSVGVHGEGVGALAQWIKSVPFFPPYVQGYQALEASDLEYTYIRMGGLHNDASKVDYVLQPTVEPTEGGHTSRFAASRFVLALLKDLRQDVRASIAIYDKPQ